MPAAKKRREACPCSTHHSKNPKKELKHRKTASNDTKAKKTSPPAEASDGWQLVGPRGSHRPAILSESESEPRASIHESTFPQKKDPPREDLFRRFPPEIRNRIYDLLASPTAEDHTSPITIRFRKWRPGSTTQQEFLRWKEPGLLLAAKWIRLEANYYQTRPIEIAMSTADIGAACKWLRRIVDADEEEKVLGRVTFWLVSGSWDDVLTRLPLAQLVREYTFRREGTQVTKPESTNDRQDLPVVKAGHERYSHLAAALDVVVANGMRAKLSGLGEAGLETDFREWVKVRRQSRGFRGHRPY